MFYSDFVLQVGLVLPAGLIFSSAGTACLAAIKGSAPKPLLDSAIMEN